MEYLIGKEEDFYDFIDGIKEKDKVAIITHTDLDGIASGILIKEILKSKKIKTKIIEFINYGTGMFNPFLDKFKKKKITKIFVLDINEESDYYSFNLLRDNFDILLIDHHPSKPENKNRILKTSSENCAAWTIYNLGQKITNLEKWKDLICATMITEFSYNNKNNFNFLKSNFPEIKKENIIESKPGELSVKINSSIIYLKNDLKKAFNLIFKNKINKIERFHKLVEEEFKFILEKFKKEAEFYPEKNLYIFYYNPKFSIGSSIATKLSMQEQNKTFLFISDIKKEPAFVKFSARNQSGKIDLNEFLKKGIKDLENANAGGHFKASGGKIMKKDLGKFKNNLIS